MGLHTTFKSAIMNKENIPLVSVLMPVYNGEKFLRESISSIQNQTLKDFELLIIDDGSTDGSIKIVESISDERIKLIKNDHNCGIVKTLNLGIALAHGKYIARMDADDISEINRLKIQVDYMEAHGDVVLCGSSINRFSTDYSIIDHREGEDGKLRAMLLFDTTVNHPSAIFRRDILVKNDINYPSYFEHAEDYGLWYQLSKYGKIVNLPEVLLRYRMHGSNLSMKFNASQFDNMSKVRLIVLSDFLNKTDLSDAAKNELIGKYKYFLELPTADFNDILAFENFLKQLFKLNEQFKIYDANGLKSASAWFWYVVFVHGKCKKYSWKMIPKFLLNKNSICQYVTKPERKKFLVKCLLRWKVK